MEPLHRFVNQLVIMPEESWIEFRNLFAQAKLNKGDLFVQPGKVETRFAFLESGLTRTYYCNSKGKEFTKKIHSPGGLIGSYTSMTQKSANAIYVQALTDCSILVADYNKVESLYDSHPLIERFARRLAEVQYVLKEKREMELAMLSAEERYNIFKKEFPGLESDIPQYFVASYLGITPTQLSRIRAKKTY